MVLLEELEQQARDFRVYNIEEFLQSKTFLNSRYIVDRQERTIMPEEF